MKKEKKNIIHQTLRLVDRTTGEQYSSILQPKWVNDLNNLSPEEKESLKDNIKRSYEDIKDKSN